MQYNVDELFESLKLGDIKSLSRCISIVENEVQDYEKLLLQTSNSNKTIVGITGSPGAGKSTLTDVLIGEIVAEKKKVAVLCIDPSSPFSQGALLGDRIRMSQWYNHPGVYIRSLSSRGSFGGLHPKIVEITDLVKAAPLDYILVETVGVGQSEVEIASLADTTVVVVVPEAGDEIQMMKAGLMEVADIFVVNKSDRPGADQMLKNLKSLTHSSAKRSAIPVLKTAALQKQGVKELLQEINKHNVSSLNYTSRIELLVKKATHLIIGQKMKNFNQMMLKENLEKEYQEKEDAFNLFKFVYNKGYE